MAQPLFLAGLGRSGTTALTELFDAHPRIAIGMERYKLVSRKPDEQGMTPELFTRERFFDFSDGLTNITPDEHPRWRDFYAALEAKWDDAAYVGDKITHVRMNPIWEGLPDARFVCIVRDVRSVAASWDRRAANPDDKAWSSARGAQSAVTAWNRTLSILARMKRRHGDKVALVEYASLFGDPEGTSAGRVLDWLGLEPDSAFDAAFTSAHEHYARSIAKKPRALSDEDEAYVVEHADLDRWERVCRRAL